MLAAGDDRVPRGTGGGRGMTEEFQAELMRVVQSIDETLKQILEPRNGLKLAFLAIVTRSK